MSPKYSLVVASDYLFRELSTKCMQVFVFLITPHQSKLSQSVSIWLMMTITQFVVFQQSNWAEMKKVPTGCWLSPETQTLPSEETPTQHSVEITARHTPVWHMSTCSTCTLRHMDWARGCTMRLPASHLKKHWHISRAGRGWLLVPGVHWKALMNEGLVIRQKTALVRTEAELWSPSGVQIGAKTSLFKHDVMMIKPQRVGQ